MLITDVIRIIKSSYYLKFVKIVLVVFRITEKKYKIVYLLTKLLITENKNIFAIKKRRTQYSAFHIFLQVCSNEYSIFNEDFFIPKIYYEIRYFLKTWQKRILFSNHERSIIASIDYVEENDTYLICSNLFYLSLLMFNLTNPYHLKSKKNCRSFTYN